MNDYHCLYCGHPTLEKFIPPKETRTAKDIKIQDLVRKELQKDLLEMGLTPSPADEDNLCETFQCPNCRLIIDEADLADTVRHRKENGSAGDDAVNEEETLQAARQLMRNEGWEKALSILYPPAPCKYPLEFMVYRSICFFGDNTAQPYACGVRCRILDTLNSNIKCLEYFLSAGGSGAEYRTLQNLHRALMFLGSLEIHCDTNYDKNSSFIDHTNSKRAEVLCSLAEILKARNGDPEHGTDYLKMAAELFHKCLELAQERYCHILLSWESKKFQISRETRKNINAEIVKLNEAISLRDSSFVPRKALPDPKIMPCWLVFAAAFLPLLILAAAVCAASYSKEFQDMLIACIMNGYLPIPLFIITAGILAYIYRRYNNVPS